MTRIRWIEAALPIAAALLVSNCKNELAPTTLATVTLHPATPWPDTLSVTEIATVLTNVVGPSGNIEGVTLEWSSSDSSVLQVRPPIVVASLSDAELLSNGRRAIITTQGPGTATIIARLNRAGFVPAELRVPVVVRQRTLPALLTVSNEDTVGVGLASADRAVLGTLSYSWQSSDPSVLQATSLSTDASRAVITARASGTAQVTLAVTGERLGRVEFREAFNVGGVQIVEQPAWPTLLPVTEATQLAVAIQDAAGSPLPSAKVVWSSTNLSAFTVDSNGVVTSLSRGGGEVVASVGSPPFQVAEHRAALQVVEKWSNVSAGTNHTCAIAALDGTGYCWGSNADGKLGLGFTASALTQASRPRRVSTSHKFAELKAGDTHTCGSEGSVNLLCWGSRQRGQLGDGQCAPFNGSCGGSFSAAPLPVSVISDGNLGTDQILIEQLLVGGSYTCILARVRVGFLNRVRRLRCWGTTPFNDNFGIAFDTTAASAVPLPPRPDGDQTKDFIEVSAGGQHLCAKPNVIFLTFTLECLGMNFNGELGTGPPYPGDPFYHQPAGFGKPVGQSDTTGFPVGDGIPTSGLSAGAGHTCALDAVGVLCWGSNSAGQLGTTVADPAYFPVRAAVPVAVVSLAAGGAHTCALTAIGDAWCWGSNSNGQLGRGTIGGIGQPPALVSGGLTFVSISAGGVHTCGVTPNGSIYCWGANVSGQLGDGTTADRAAPVRVVEAP